MDKINIDKFSDGSVNASTHEWEGSGIFDVIMKAVNGNIQTQFNKNRIVGPEYANVYLGSIQTAITESLKYIKEQPMLESELAISDYQLNTILPDGHITNTKQHLLLDDDHNTNLKQQVLLGDNHTTNLKQQLLLDEQLAEAYVERVMKDKETAKLGLDSVMKTTNVTPTAVYVPKYIKA